MDAFSHGMDFPYLMGLSIPFIDDLFDAQLVYLKEKRKAEKEAMNST
jgi:hypothetical protein